MLKTARRPQGIFVTGTDTGIGKTFVSTLLCALFKNDFSLKYFKPIQTGCELDNDTATVMKNAQLSEHQRVPTVYSLELPASPDRAAVAEGVRIQEQDIFEVFNKNREHFLIVEGAGGIEVPIREEYRMLDLMRAMQLPVLVVASTRLGTINQTLLTLKSLRAAGVSVMGVVLNGPEDVGLKEVLEREGARVLAEVPLVLDEIKDYQKLSQCLEPLRACLSLLETTSDLTVRDAQAIWHPFTQHKTEKDFPTISRGVGATLFTETGHALLDATSSWWVNLHGHGQREIAEAISEQAGKLEHVVFAGYTHEPAVRLSESLLQEAQRVNPEWSRVFFSDNGSTAVEVALKMAYQYHQLRGQSRKKFLALHHSYHGDTVGAMSVSDRDGYHKYFLPLMSPVDHVEPDDFAQLERLLPHMSEYAACIVEPLVQGAGGMRMYSAQYLQQLQKYCRAHGVLLIADEIFTGFGRTGTFLASEQADFRADLLCLSKGITGGFLPLSVTIATEVIFETFLADRKAQAFLHGHSYTANPLACAAALKSFEILKRVSTQERIEAITARTKDHLQGLQEKHHCINGVRSLGTIGALDLKTDESYFDGTLAQKISQFCFEHGVLLRPLGATVYAVPPYCTTDQELEYIYKTISAALTEVFAAGDV